MATIHSTVPPCLNDPTGRLVAGDDVPATQRRLWLTRCPLPYDSDDLLPALLVTMTFVSVGLTTVLAGVSRSADDLDRCLHDTLWGSGFRQRVLQRWYLNLAIWQRPTHQPLSLLFLEENFLFGANGLCGVSKIGRFLSKSLSSAAAKTPLFSNPYIHTC